MKIQLITIDALKIEEDIDNLVEKSIKENLGDIFSEESIVGETKIKNLKFLLRGIKEYQFVLWK